MARLARVGDGLYVAVHRGSLFVAYDHHSNGSSRRPCWMLREMFLDRTGPGASPVFCNVRGSWHTLAEVRRAIDAHSSEDSR